MTTELEDIDFEYLIGDKDIDICWLIKAINEQGIAGALFHYACYTLEGRWPEAEPYIIEDPVWASYYARDVIGRRWLEAEPYIMKNSYWAYNYFSCFGVEL